MQHTFSGRWITDGEFSSLPTREVRHRQLDAVRVEPNEHRNAHILFSKTVTLSALPKKAVVYVSADDVYKLYINGRFADVGPVPSCPEYYAYREVDVTRFLTEGENRIAVHTLYQGLINRVFQSGDNRHGLLLDFVVDGVCLAQTDASWKTARHDAYTEVGIAGYQTQFLERYDSRAAAVGFEKPGFDDTAWAFASVKITADYQLTPESVDGVITQTVLPMVQKRDGNLLFLDFGQNYVGYLAVTARGQNGDVITVREGQELWENGRVRYEMRCCCTYEEPWVLSGDIDMFDPFDYSSFRYAELMLPQNVEILSVALLIRHAPFSLQVKPQAQVEAEPSLHAIWNLCVNTQKYGTQEVLQDCMDREKGFYVGDGCYTALTRMVLTGDDRLVKKLVDDFFFTTAITPTGVTCLDCSFMQEIAEYPLILVYLLWWQYRYTGDISYLKQTYPKVISLLEAFRIGYEKDGLLCNLDKWCVVEWPDNFRDGYDAEITEGKVCTDVHIAIQIYYHAAIRTANRMAEALGIAPYREMAPLDAAFQAAFYQKSTHRFRDRIGSDHTSFIAEILMLGFGYDLTPAATDVIFAHMKEKKVHAVNLFGAFPYLLGCLRYHKNDLLREALLDDGAWLRMIKEGATTTFEGWGKDTKWNTSLCHMTLSYGALFLCDAPLTDWLL